MISKIPFNKPFQTGLEKVEVEKAILLGDLSGNGFFTKRCESILEDLTQSSKVLLTPSCTDALELAALLIEIEEGDEVIMASFNFVSAANAFVLRGAKIIFVDIRPDTLNIDENLIEAAITPRTRAIVAMHYAGVACEMQSIMAIAEKYGIYVVEDAAHCIDAYYNNYHLGSIGHFGTISFHSTKNIHCGEGGALLVNDKSFVERAEVIREKGTNRSQFERKEVEYYSWADLGSSFLMGELSAAYLFSQLQHLRNATNAREIKWLEYSALFENLREKVQLPVVSPTRNSNYHIFYLKCENSDQRRLLIAYLKANGIQALFHYIPLHSSVGGKKYGFFWGEDNFTTTESERLLRLPLFNGFDETALVYESVKSFFCAG